MSETPGQQLSRLCEALFGRRPPASHIDKNLVRALSPKHHFLYIVQNQRAGTISYSLHWLSPHGAKGWFGTSLSHQAAQQDLTDHEVPSPPKELLEELAAAMPLPVAREWGFLEKGQLAQMILFNGRKVTVIPGALFVVAKGATPTLHSRLYADGWLQLPAFWEAVRHHQLVPVRKQLARRGNFQVGEIGGGYYAIAGDEVFAHPTVWERYPDLNAAYPPGQVTSVKL